MLARDLINDFTDQYLEMNRAGASNGELAEFLKNHSQYHSQHLGKADNAEICCGQVAGLINEIQSAREVVDDVVGNIVNRFDELKQRLACFSQS
jgi:enoyl-[acyl-carrier protein] reductase II